MKPTSIQVQVDTNIINDNTADGFAVLLSYETPLVGDYKSGNIIIKGNGLKQTEQKTVTQGDLKTELANINSQIAGLITRQGEVLALLGDVAVAVDTEIINILASGGTDNRTL